MQRIVETASRICYGASTCRTVIDQLPYNREETHMEPDGLVTSGLEICVTHRWEVKQEQVM